MLRCADLVDDGTRDACTPLPADVVHGSGQAAFGAGSSTTVSSRATATATIVRRLPR